MSNVAELKPLPFSDFSKSLGPGYRKPRYMESNVGGRFSNCIPSQGTRYTGDLNDMERWNREILESVRRSERLDEGELAEKFERDYHGDGHVIIAKNYIPLI